MIRMELQEGKNTEAVQERFYNTLYDALCKNQEGYNLICMINESGLKNNQMECLYTTSLCKKKSQHRQKIHITDNIYMLKREEGLIVLFFLLYFLLHSMFALNKYLFLFST